MSDYSYPTELIKKAESRIRAQLDGNGIDPKSITLSIKRQGQGIVTAQTLFTFDSYVKTSSQKGKKPQGRMVNSGQIQSEIKTYINDISSVDSVHSLAIEKIKSLPLQGFGIKKTEIKTDENKLVLSECHDCNQCKGQGKSRCQYCIGKGQINCPLCHASGYVRCLTCSGSRTIEVNGNQIACSRCQGRGQIYCTQCSGQRVMPCANCQAKGMTTCAGCGGEGVNTINATVTPFIKVESNVFFQDLDNDPKNMVGKIGALELAKGGHIITKIVAPPQQEEVKRAYYEREPEPKSKNIIYYEADIDWAVADIKINDAVDNINIIGLKGAISDGGKFMDRQLQKPLTLIAQAARGEGIVSSLLHDASKFRVSRETLSAVTMMKPKKAVLQIQKKYAIGFARQTIPQFVKNSYLALKRVTRRSRYIGMGIGLFISTALYYHWFINDSRVLSENYDVIVRYAIDALPLLAGIILNFIMIKSMAYFTFRSVMRDIGITTKKMPVVGMAGIYGMIGNLILWGGLLAATTFNLY